MSRAWIRADWPADARIVAGTTLREGGASSGTYRSFNIADHVGDDPAAVASNRRRLQEFAGIAAEPLWLQQVHGSVAVRNPARGTKPVADAAYCNRPGETCVVMTADCLPVLFASQDAREIAAAHAGWRGLCAGILEATVAHFEAPGEQLMAWLGPAISREAFEVGDEVRQAFVDIDAAAASCFEQNERGRWQADLYALARQRLAACGITAVYGGTHCTFGNSSRFFSYRRDGQCGRMASFITLPSA
jgi:YfiH family protein